MKEDEGFRQSRERMVELQIKGRDITDPAVLRAMQTVPRHLFVPEKYQHLAYADAPLAIGHGQTISQPYIVALMTQLLQVSEGDTVLEIGTGSGYQAAVLATLASKVYTLERIPELAERARSRLQSLGFTNVEVLESDGTLGLPAHAPYQGILVTAAAPYVPAPLKEQLADEGSLVLPVGSRFGQTLERWRRKAGIYNCERLVPVAFVPLIGEFGWRDDERRINP